MITGDFLYNYPVRGTAADGFKLALIDLDDQLDGKDARIVHILHDEVIVEARTDIVESVAETVKECMEKAFADVLPGVPFVVKRGTGNKGFLGLLGRCEVFAASCDFQQKKPVFSSFSQPLRIFSGGYGSGLVQILAVLMNLKYRWTEITGFA